MGCGEYGSAGSVELGCLCPNQEKAPVGMAKAPRAAILDRDPELMYLGTEQTLLPAAPHSVPAGIHSTRYPRTIYRNHNSLHQDSKEAPRKLQSPGAELSQRLEGLQA